MSALFALVRFEAAGLSQSELALILLALVLLLRREPWVVLTILARRVRKAGNDWVYFIFGKQAKHSQEAKTVNSGIVETAANHP
jgi:hypothetical protein